MCIGHILVNVFLGTNDDLDINVSVVKRVVGGRFLGHMRDLQRHVKLLYSVLEILPFNVL